MKIGIVGLGFMGAAHLAAYSKLEEVELAGVCTTNERALSGDLTQVGGNIKQPGAMYDFSGIRRWTQWRELVLDAAIDAVDVCLPTDLHSAVVLAALAAGKHVLCEKPMALTAAECDRMLRAAEEQSRVLMIGHVLRFWPEYQVLTGFVRDRPHGAVRSARFLRKCGLPDWSSWLPVEARSGGAVLDLLVHDIDQILMLFGVPESVTATAAGEVDTLTATLSYPGGLEVRLEGGWLLPGAPFSMEFQAQAERAALELNPDGLFLNNETGRHEMQSPGSDAYDAEIGYFVECCRAGSRPERCPPQQSAQAVKLALLLKQSRAAGGAQIKCLF